MFLVSGFLVHKFIFNSCSRVLDLIQLTVVTVLLGFTSLLDCGQLNEFCVLHSKMCNKCRFYTVTETIQIKVLRKLNGDADWDLVSTLEIYTIL